MQKKIAITGGIGSGKSLASQYVAEMGYPVFSCDEINKQLWSDNSYVEKVKTLFPNCVKNGTLDKNIIKNTVFSDKTALEKLNAVAHPLIMERLLARMSESKSALVFAEVPLLFEGGYEDLFDIIIVITRNLEDRIHAVQQRDGLHLSDVQNRIRSQFDYAKIENRIKNLNAYIIKNEGEKITLKNNISNIISRL